jgi:cytochrome P450
MDAVNTGSIIQSDPPMHRQLRREIKHLFTPRAVARMEPVIRDLARELIAAIEPGQPFDLIGGLAARLPTWVIGEMLGVPPADRATLEHTVDASTAFEDPSASGATGADAIAKGMAYLAQMIQERRRRPGDDLLSALIAAAEAGGNDDATLMKHAFVVLAGGTETVRTVVTQGVLALTQHPDQKRRFFGEPGLLSAAIDELLRWSSPVNHFARTALDDVELRGRKIRKGDQVLMVYGSANRDEQVFGPDSEQLRLDRDPNPHLSFGVGEHFCVGSHLARLELRVIFEELLGRFRDVEIVGEPRRVFTVLACTHASMQVAWS